jgi:mitochondrial chaperone BCS1
MHSVSTLPLTICHSVNPRSEWMMFWLSSLPQWRLFRAFTVAASGFSIEDDAGLAESMDEATRRRTPPVRYLPSYASSYRMWYKGKLITISRTKEDSRWYNDKSTLTITLVLPIYQ